MAHSVQPPRQVRRALDSAFVGRQNDDLSSGNSFRSDHLQSAKKEYLANDTAEVFVQRMHAEFANFDGDVPLHQLRFLFPKS